MKFWISPRASEKKNKASYVSIEKNMKLVKLHGKLFSAEVSRLKFGKAHSYLVRMLKATLALQMAISFPDPLFSHYACRRACVKK